MSQAVPVAAWAIVLLFPIVLYSRTLGFPFLWDDRPLLIENPIVRSPQSLAEIFTTSLDPGARTGGPAETNYLRPLFISIAVLLRRVLGDDPRAWHAVTVLLHSALCGLAFALLRREGASGLTAVAAALFFAVHPSHVHSTAWISGMQDLLFGVTAIAAFLAYRHSQDAPVPAPPRLLGLAFAFGIALLTKEPAIGFVLFVAAEAVRLMPPSPGKSHDRRPVAELVVLLLVSAGYFAYRVTVLGTLAHRFPTAPAMPEALASVPVALIAYVKDLVFPVNLFLIHPARPVAQAVSSQTLLALVSVLSLAAVAVIAAARTRALARPLAWMVAWIAPVLAVWAVNPEWMVVDRYLLLPSLGLAWAMALMAPMDADRARRGAVWVILIVAGSLLSLAAMRPFESEDRFWSEAVKADPGSSTAWTEWARKRSEAGDLDAASEALRRAVELDPQAQLPRLRQALLTLRRGDAGGAVTTLRQLIERNPRYVPAWRNLVVALSRSGDNAAAEETLTRALDLFPADPVLWTQRAILLRQAGRGEQALEALRRARALAPDDKELAAREAQLLSELGR